MGNLPYYSCNINHWSVFWLWIDEIRWCHHIKLPGKIIVYYNASVTKLVDKQDTINVMEVCRSTSDCGQTSSMQDQNQQIRKS